MGAEPVRVTLARQQEQIRELFSFRDEFRRYASEMSNRTAYILGGVVVGVLLLAAEVALRVKGA